MRKINVLAARASLSLLTKQIANDKPFIASKAETISRQICRIGFFSEKVSIPDDFDSMGQKEVEQLFTDESHTSGR